jgi:hypothetical protein
MIPYRIRKTTKKRNTTKKRKTTKKRNTTKGNTHLLHPLWENYQALYGSSSKEEEYDEESLKLN